MENKNIFKVVDSDDVHQYDIKVIRENNQIYPIRYELYASNGNDWTHEVKGKLFLSITDTGDLFQLDKKIKKLDYEVAEQLIMLFKFINYNHTTRGGIFCEKYKVVQCTTLIDL